MAEEFIDKIIDRGSITADKDFLVKTIQEMQGELDKVKTISVEIKGAKTFQEISTSATTGSKSIDAVEKSAKRLAFAISNENIELQKNNALTQLANKEAKALGKEQAGLSNEYDKQSKRLNELKNQLKGLVAAGKDSGSEYEKLRNEFAQLNEIVIKANRSVGDFRDNVGNYEGSAKIIVDALDKEKKKLEELLRARQNIANIGTGPYNPGQANVAASVPTVTGSAASSRTGIGFNASREVQSLEVLDKQIEETKQKLEALEKVTENDRFLNIAGKTGDATAQIKFFTKALIDLERQGLGNTDVANNLRKQLAELTDQVSDAKAEIKALSSDTRGFDLFAGSVSFAADAFQTFAGAAVLAGASEEDAAEATKTLVAVQSVANGVKGIANELTTRGTAANKLFAFTQNQISIATNASASAFTRFKAALAATGVGLLVIGIGLLVANFDKLKRALGFASEAQDAYNETLEDYRGAAKEAIENVSKVGVAFEQAKAGVISKDEALFEYNKTLGDTFGKTNDVAEAERLYAEKADTYIKVQGLKAQANALFAKSADAITKGITAEQEDQTGLFDKLKVGLKQYVGDYKGASESLINAQKEGAANAKKEAADLGNALQAEGEKLLKESQELANAFKISTNTDFDKEKEKKAKEAADKAKKLLEERLNAELNLQKRNLAAAKAILIEGENEKIRSNQKIIDSENTSFKEQLAAIENIAQAKKNITAIELADAVKAEKEVKDARIVEINKTQKEIEAAKIASDNKINAINDDTLKLQLDAQKRHTEKIKEELEKEKQERLKATDALFQGIRDKNKDEYNSQIQALNESFKRGEISQELYNKKRLDIELSYQTATLVNEIEYQKKLLAAADITDDKRAEALRKLSDLEKELSDESLQNFKNGEEEKRAAALETFDKIKSGADTAFTLIGDILNISTTKQKNKIQDESDAAAKKAAEDIKATETSLATEEEKAAKIQIINARLAAQKEQYARREREINLQNARFEKTKNIFSIALQTARSIAEASPNPLKIAFAAALGAVQLGIAVATPLPRYFKGKNLSDLYSGPALLNDGGKDEMQIHEDGRIERITGRNVIKHVNSGDIIHPDANVFMQDLQAAALRDIGHMAAGGTVNQNSYGAVMSAVLEQKINEQNKLLKQIADKPVPNVRGTKGGMEQLWRHGANTVKYIDQQTNWS